MFILIDKEKTVKCMASEACNLWIRDHNDKVYRQGTPEYDQTVKELDYQELDVERKGTVGDKYDSSVNLWTSKPENYPKTDRKDVELELINLEKLIKAAEDVETKTGIKLISKEGLQERYEYLVAELKNA
jgi:hypothetical protein